jgi:hypothetical protein
MPRKVFVPNFVDSNDYSSAQEFGELVFLTEGVIVVGANTLHKKFETYFKNANEGDYLLLSGSNLVCATAYAEWCARFPAARDLIVHDRRFGYRIHHIVDNGEG